MIKQKFYLECPECQDCFTPEELNESVVRYSIALGSVESYIPDTEEEYYNWLQDIGGTIDCPSCGEVICLEDCCVV